jgi:hypothetical protein
MLHLAPCAIEPLHVPIRPLLGGLTVHEFGAQLCNALICPKPQYIVVGPVRVYPAAQVIAQLPPCAIEDAHEFHTPPVGRLKEQEAGSHCCVFASIGPVSQYVSSPTTWKPGKHSNLHTSPGLRYILQSPGVAARGSGL